MTDFGPHLERYQEGFRAGGLAINRAETYETQVAFRNLGEIAYLLTALPWEVPDFDVGRDISAGVGWLAYARRGEDTRCCRMCC